MTDSTAEETELQVVVAPAIEKRILVIRGRQVMLDEDLADLYGVETKRLVQQVKRNLKRFPEDFMFQLTKAEAEVLRSHIATSNDGPGGRRYAPYVFSEQGVAMLSGVLRSDRAITVNIEADICVSESPQTEMDAISIPLPDPGQRWSRSQVISALQRFHRYWGRPPRARECRAVNRLPSIATICRHFPGLEAAILAAGILPAEHGRRRRPWQNVEAARTCRSFYRRFGYWPDASDRKRAPDLPSRSAMISTLGSVHGGEIRDVAEAILAAERTG